MHADPRCRRVEILLPNLLFLLRGRTLGQSRGLAIPLLRLLQLRQHSLLSQGAPWSVRLAAKLLREKSRGAGSPWSAYLAILPKVVPSTLTAFEWEDMQARPTQRAPSD